MNCSNVGICGSKYPEAECCGGVVGGVGGRPLSSLRLSFASNDLGGLVCEVGNHVLGDRKVDEMVESCCILCRGGWSAECHDCWYRRSFLATEGSEVFDLLS